MAELAEASQPPGTSPDGTDVVAFGADRIAVTVTPLVQSDWEDEMSDSDITNKALVDLWMHQNRLMWDRLNTLGILQIAMLGAAYGLSAEQWSAPLIFYTLVSLVAYTITLWHRSDVDRCVREKHSLRLKKMGLDVRLDLTNEDDMKLWDDASYLAPYLKHFGSKFYMSIIFGSFIIFDLGAEAVLMYRASLH